jgi:hypothetical protein
MIYDTSSQRLVFFGGFVLGEGVKNDLWELDGIANAWRLRYGDAPEARTGHSLVYDPLQQCAYMFGGAQNVTGSYYGDTWHLQVEPGVDILQSPLSQGAVAESVASFTVLANPRSGLSYQWRRDGLNLVNGGNIAGANATTLIIAPVNALDAGYYDVLVSNSLCVETSAEAYLWVLPPCAADISPSGGDGIIGIDDLFEVLNAWGDCPNPCSCVGDVNLDCSVDISDVFLVITTWGSCGPD